VADPKSSETAAPFLQRWSARKANKTALDEPGEPKQEQAAEVLSTPPQDRQVPQELSDADMPPLESLDANSDYRPFFSENVSAELRRLALRKLFHLPQFNIRDGLDDYDDDFTQFTPLGDTVTADMKHQWEMLRQREQAAAREEGQDQLKLDADSESVAVTESKLATETRSESLPEPQDTQHIESGSEDKA